MVGVNEKTPLSEDNGVKSTDSITSTIMLVFVLVLVLMAGLV